MNPELWPIVSTSLLAIIGALGLYARNVAKRSDPNFQKELEKSLLERIDAERLRFTNEHESLLQKFGTLETKFDTFREIAEKRAETLEATIEALKQTVAGLTAENNTLKREAGQAAPEGEK